MVPKGNLHATETTVIDGIEYETFYLGGNNQDNINLIMENNKNASGNYRYIMTADWHAVVDLNSSNFGDDLHIGGTRIILDLNGFTLSTECYIFFDFQFEITDSSPTQSGVAFNSISSDAIFALVNIGGSGRCIISGGTIKSRIDFHASIDLMIFGGKLNNKFRLFNSDLHSLTSLTVAPWVDVTFDENGFPTSFISNDYYAVSTSNLVSGVYNTAYGYQWDLSANALSKLTLPTDKTYYLWARDADDKYQFLNLRCTDGKTWEKYSQ